MPPIQHRPREQAQFASSPDLTGLQNQTNMVNWSIKSYYRQLLRVQEKRWEKHWRQAQRKNVTFGKTDGGFKKRGIQEQNDLLNSQECLRICPAAKELQA